MTRPIIEIAFGYTLTSALPVWTDISRYVELVGGAIGITRGAANELAQTETGTASLTLHNDGRFTSGRMASPYWPNVRKKVPVRIAVVTMDSPSGSVPYALEQFSDAFDDGRIDTSVWPGNFGQVSETEGRARINAVAGIDSGFLSAASYRLWGSNVTVRLARVPAGGTNARTSFMVNSGTFGTRIGFEYNATTGFLSCKSDVTFFDAGQLNLTYSAADHLWLRVREASGSVFFETSSDGHTWTVRRTVASPAWVGTDQVRVQMYASRDSGTTDFAEYDYLGARVHPRYFGTVNEWPVEWKGLQAKAVITCTDVFNWADIAKELQPMLVQEVLLDRPMVYFPLSEPDGSASAGDVSGTAGVASLSIVQASAGGTLAFGSVPGPSGGLNHPLFTPASSSAGKYLSADLGPNFTDANVFFRTRSEVWFSTSTSGRVLFALASADNAMRLIFSLESGTGKVKIEYAQDGSPLQSFVAATPNLADGNLHYLLFNEFDDELTIDGTLYGAVTTSTSDFRTLTVGGFGGQRLWSGTIAHMAIYVRSVTTAELNSHYTTGVTEHVGESAAARMSRLASYVGLTVTSQGSVFDAMASQEALGKSALEHMREVETTEAGKLLASRSNSALIFQSRSLRYNPTAALSLAYADLETDGVKYADDDQKTVNDVTASRLGGATQRVINAASIATYGPKPRNLELLKNSDNSAADAANWLVSRYSDPPSEIRQVPIEAFSMPLATYRALLAADVSTVLGLTALPTEAPASTATAIVEGYSETIALGSHKIDFHTSRADTDNVWILDDSVHSVLDSTTRLAY
ncbi:hypothetical protein ACFY3G_17885 [Streptomyces phaeochromogenes]|uniref:hypothetical protein n=1 Tax=Streptomyces phaeochromogenes TaxID=1923 RepID=UPI0036A8ACBF